MATTIAKKGKDKNEVAIMDENMFAVDAGIGVSDLSSEDLAIPFLKVLQKMSDELDDLDDAKAGDIYNTVTKNVVKGKDGVTVINCAYSLQYIEWEPRGTGTGAPQTTFPRPSAATTTRITSSGAADATSNAPPSITSSSLTRTA